MKETPYRFERTHDAASLRAEFGSIGAGHETGLDVSVAGRLMLNRPQGKLAFGELRDSSGSIQLFAGASWTEDFEGFSRLSLGDWIGAAGEVVKTRKGELSVRVRSWVLLAEARRGFGDKWRGVTDVDTRSRQRYVDLWANPETRQLFLLRSRLVGAMRTWLEDRGFVEVETPVFHPVPGGADARPFVTHHNTLDVELYLRIATELYLKRLVVGGFEKVFEIGRTFRNEGIGYRWNPEFTMLEAYQAYADYTDMMELTEAMVADLANEVRGSTKLSYRGRPLDFTPPWRRATMYELVEEHAGVRVDVQMPVAELVRTASELGVRVEEGWGPGKLVLEIYEKTTERDLWGPVFVCDYPQEVSPLARPHRSKPGLVERFEPIVAGLELGNAFSELTDPDVQRQVLEAQARARSAGDQDAMAVDRDFLRALDYGMPPTGGLGIGIDRLVMLLADVHHIRDVILFPTLRPEQGAD
ncbi:MAG TPA: lysine--tRNA ligase [Acidimicrobiales bacterium]|nr:lysine--tRNA ligase [Acidimicrobiales bacterium]